MFWTTALRTVRTASRASTTRVAKPRTYAATTRFIGIRFNSSKPESDEAALKQARKLKDKLNHNWDTPILTYEQLKPKTARPSPVCTTRLHSRHLVLISLWCILRTHTLLMSENQMKSFKAQSHPLSISPSPSSPTLSTYLKRTSRKNMDLINRGQTRRLYFIVGVGKGVLRLAILRKGMGILSECLVVGIKCV